MLKRSHVAIARLRHPLNLGNKCEEVSFVIAIVAPKKEVIHFSRQTRLMTSAIYCYAFHVVVAEIH